MENSSQEIEITIIPDELEELATLMTNKMSCLVSSSKCCIYKIPEYVRKGKEECYRPLVMSIGPVYYNSNPDFETMQRLKWMTLKWFLKYGGDHNLVYYLNCIREKETEIRECYQENTENIPSNEFIQLILLDAVFTIYLFLDNYESSDFEIDIIPTYEVEIPKDTRVLMRSHMDRDLFLLGNQLPYFVLKHVYDVSFGTVLSLPFIELTRDYLGSRSPWTLPGSKAVNSRVAIDRITQASNIQHLLDFLCCCLSLPPLQPQKQKHSTNKAVKCCFSAIEKVKNFLGSYFCISSWICKNRVEMEEIFPLPAKQLRAAGVKFKASESVNPLHIHFADGVLEIPKISLDDNTEAALRNILYFENCHYYYNSRFVDYMYFLDGLINTEEDIQILVKNNILESLLGTRQEAADIFNKVVTNTTLNTFEFSYSKVSRELNAYANTSWNRWKAILRRNYFHHPWSIVSVIYLVVLLILTVLQVYTGFKS